jgi:hypothetical protein
VAHGYDPSDASENLNEEIVELSCDYADGTPIAERNAVLARL